MKKAAIVMILMVLVTIAVTTPETANATLYPMGDNRCYDSKSGSIVGC